MILLLIGGECLDICINGGTCDNGACLCPIGFAGTSCEIPGEKIIVIIFIGNERKYLTN